MLGNFGSPWTVYKYLNNVRYTHNWLPSERFCNLLLNLESVQGFVPTLTTMGVSWCFLVLEALLLAEINVALLEQHKNESSCSVLSLRSIAEKTLGPLGGTISACIYTFLSYTVMVAYIAKSGDILSPLIHMSPLLSCWIFTLVFGSLTLLGSTNLVTSFNRILTSAMIGKTISMFTVFASNTNVHIFLRAVFSCRHIHIDNCWRFWNHRLERSPTHGLGKDSRNISSHLLCTCIS